MRNNGHPARQPDGSGCVIHDNVVGMGLRTGRARMVNVTGFNTNGCVCVSGVDACRSTKGDSLDFPDSVKQALTNFQISASLFVTVTPSPS